MFEFIPHAAVIVVLSTMCSVSNVRADDGVLRRAMLNRAARDLKDRDHRIRAAAARRLGTAEADPASVLDLLRNAITDPEPTVREAVVTALGRRAPEAAVPELLGACCADAVEKVRSAAREAIVRVRSVPPKAVPAFKRAVRDPRDSVRACAAQVIRVLNQRVLTALLPAMLQDKSRAVRAAAIGAVFTLRVDLPGVVSTVEAIARRAPTSDDYESKLERLRALTVLAALRPRHKLVVPAALPLAHDRDYRVRGMALIVFQQLSPRPPVVAATLAAALRDPHSAVRNTAARILGVPPPPPPVVPRRTP
jgi:HEAT repeat protein